MQEKRKFHEVLSLRLAANCVGIDARATCKASNVELILRVFGESKMKATDAHLVAVAHRQLPEDLRKAGQTVLAELATKVLEDLNGRQDESQSSKKPYFTGVND